MLPYRALREVSNDSAVVQEKGKDVMVGKTPDKAVTTATVDIIEKEEEVVLPTTPREIKNGLAISEGIDFPCTQSNGKEALACQISCNGRCAEIATDVCQSIKHCIGFSVNRENTWATLKVSRNS